MKHVWSVLAAFALGLCLSLPARAQDAVNLSQTTLSSRDSIDVRNWPTVITLQSVTLGGDYERGDTKVDFAGKYALPSVINMEGGAITYTMWLGFHLSDGWHIFAAVNCINDYVPTGPMLQPGQMANLTYYLDGPMATYQPQPGEHILVFVTTGVTRRDNRQAPAPFQFGRSNVVVVPFAPGTYTEVVPPVPPVENPPEPQPPSTLVLTEAVTALQQRVRELDAAYADLHTRLGLLETTVLANDQTVAVYQETVREIGRRVTALEAKPIPASCTVRAFGVPISCRLN